jgi:hypothetical protein
MLFPRLLHALLIRIIFNSSHVQSSTEENRRLPMAGTEITFQSTPLLS